MTLFDKLSIKKVSDVFIFSALLFFLCQLITGSTVFVMFSGCFVLMAGMLNFKSINKEVLYLYFFIVIWLLAMSIVKVGSAAEFANYLYYIFVFSIAMLIATLILELDLDVRLSRFFIRLCVISLLLLILKNGYDPDAYNMIVDGSRNYLSAYVIFCLVFYLFSMVSNGLKVNIIYPILTCFICFFLYGRTGIGLSVLLLVLSAFYIYKVKAILFFIILLFIPIIFHNEVISLYEMTNFSSGLSSPRGTMFVEYVTSLKSASSFLLGNEFKNCCNVIVEYNSNPHNSFVLSHSRFGFLMFGVIFLFYLYQFVNIKKARLFLHVLILIVFVRYSFDSFGFFNVIDFLPYYMMLKLSVYNVEINKRGKRYEC